MTADSDVQEEVRKLRDEVGELKTTTRVTKHDVANLQQGMIALGARVEKIVDQISRELKEARDTLSGEIRQVRENVIAENKILSNEIASLGKVQERSAGFYAGIIAAGTLAVTIILGLVKIMFGAKL